MEIIAHRGASHRAPENTLAAVGLAWEEQADGVEVDVHLSRDGHVMVIHDPTTLRTARRRARVADQTLVQLQQLEAGSWKGSRWAGERIPRLEEVLALLPAGKELVVEVKCNRQFLPRFAALLDRMKPNPKHLVLIGFDLPLMRLVKKRFPHLRALWVTALSRRYNWELPNGRLGAFIQKVRAAGLDGVDLDARSPLTARVVQEFHAASLLVYVWTVDSPAQARRLAKIGIDGLTTNRPGHLR